MRVLTNNNKRQYKELSAFTRFRKTNNYYFVLFPFKIAYKIAYFSPIAIYQFEIERNTVFQ